MKTFIPTWLGAATIGFAFMATSCGSGASSDNTNQKAEKQMVEKPAKLALEDFFKKPVKSGFQLSPDGTHYSYLAPWKDRMNIFVQPIGGEAVRVTNAEDRDISGYYWANDNRLIYIRDEGGNEDFYLVAVDKDGQNPTPLTKMEGVKTQIIDDLEDFPDQMIVGLNKRNPQIFDPYKLDINTGQMKMLVENPGNISGWLTDHEGNIRIAITTDGVSTSMLHRKNDKEEWKTVVTTNFKESVSPLFFTFDNKNIYATSNLGRDKSAIVLFDLETGKEVEVMYEHPEVDVSGLNYSRKRKVLTSISYYVDKPGRHFLDKASEARWNDIRSKVDADLHFGLSGVNKEENKFIVRTYSDKSKGAYYFYDAENKELTFLEDLSPWIEAKNMADMKPVKYQSRDGLTIHGYLTVPKGVEAKNLPLVVNVHGGPWARDYWGFNPEVQFLANRGYAVLQMNFRGSTGFGRSFWEASFKQWGLTMQEDIRDGAEWLIKEGIADPKRIAIYGGSYGGYATLQGLVKDSDFYACGVDYVGVSNLFSFMNTIPPYWKPYLDMMHEMVGNPENEEDKARMEKTSPALNADKIKAPLFVAQGANDPRVNIAESDQIVEALKARGVEVEYLVKDNEGHGFRNQENQFEFYRAMEKFLSQHIGDNETAEKTASVH